MKAFKKWISMLLAILLLLSVTPTTVLADYFRSEVIGEEYSLENKYIKVTVNSLNGRFSIQTVDGQPQRKNDQNTFLTFIGGIFGEGVGDRDTSFTTIRINGTDYIFGNKYKIASKGVESTMGQTRVFTSGEFAAIPEGCQAVVTDWSVEGVKVYQILLLYPETDGANSGNVQIFYQIENNSGAEVQVGARILLDTMVGSNDGPEFQIGTISSNTLKVERMLSKDPVYDQSIALENKNYWTMPGYWVMKDTLDPSNPLATNVIAYGYTDIASYRDLDYMIVSHWSKLANEKFEEFNDYKAIPAEQAEAAAEAARTQRLATLALAVAEQKEAEAKAKAEAAQGSEPGSKAQTDAQKAEEDAAKVRAAADAAVANAERAKTVLANIGRPQVGSSIIDPNLDFTTDKNDYGSADSAVAFYWSGEGEASIIPAGGSMQLGTVYGLGEIIDPTSVLAITFPDPVTQVEINPNDQSLYKNYGVFDINVEVENLQQYNMSHDSMDITLTLEKNLRFVKRDEQGNILRDANGVPQTSYGSTQTATVQKALTPEQAEAGESNPILPGEKVSTTFTVMALGKPWPTTRQYMVTASSPQLEAEFENKYGETAGDDVKALYNASRANFVFLPAVGAGTPSYSVSVSPEECFTKDPKYLTVNLTNIEAYNPGSSVRGQEAAPNFNLYIREVVTGKRYQVDVTDNVQCIVTDDGLTGDMRISYTNGTLVNEDGLPLQLDMGYELPVGEYCVEIDYISTDEDENAMLDLVTEQTFLVTENEEARIREPAILAVVKETVDFDDSEMMEKINALVEEVENAIKELESIAEKLENTDWSEAIYDELIDFAKELVSPVTQIYDSLEKLADFTNIESEMRALADIYPELADVDFSSIRNFDVAAAMKGVNVSVSLSDEFKNMFSVEELLLGPLGLSGLSDLTADGVDGVYDAIKGYGKSFLSPITDIYDKITALGDFSNLSDSDIAQLKSAFTELQNVDFSVFRTLDIGELLGNIDISVKFKKIADIEAILAGPLGDDGVSGIYDMVKEYGEDLVRPIQNLYDDILELTDFSSMTEGEIAALKAAYSDLESIDFEALKNFDLDKFLSGVEVNVSLKKKFEAMLDLETLIKGPFGGTGEGGGIYGWLQDYAKKLAAPVLSIYDDLAELTDFSNIVSEMEELSKTYKELEGVDFSALADFDIGELIDGIDVDVSLSDKFKELFDYEAILAGPFASDVPGKDAIDVFLDRITDYGKKTLSPILSIYDDLSDLTDFSDIEKDMEALSKKYDELEGVDFSALADFDLSELIDGIDVDVSLSDKFKELFDYEAILAGPFASDVPGKGAMDVLKDRITDYGKKTFSPIISIYDEVEGLANFDSIVADMTALSNEIDGLGDLDFSCLEDFDVEQAIKDMWNATTINVDLSDGFKKTVNAILDGPTEFDADAINAWLDHVSEAILAGKEVYDLGKTVYEGGLNLENIKNGAQGVMALYQKYCNASISVDWDAAISKANKNAATAAWTNGEKLALAFIAMYAKMKDIYSGLEAKYNKAMDIYHDVIGIKDKVVSIVKAVGNGDFSALVSVGKDALTFVLGEWLNPVTDAYHSVMKLYEIGQHAYRGDLSLREGAQMLVDFCETYLDISVSVDPGKANIDAAKSVYSNSEKLVLAFMAMYAKMQDIYSGLQAKYNQAKGIYNDVIGIKDKVVNTVTAIFDGNFEALLNAGKDVLTFVLGEWLDPVEDAYDSARKLYDIAQHAYKGDLSLQQGAQMLVDFCETYLDVNISVNPGKTNIAAASSLADNSQKLALAFMAMYARLQNIYSSISDKVDRGIEVYNQAKDMVNTVISVGGQLIGGDFSGLASTLEKAGTSLFETVLKAWLSPVEDVVNSAKDLYSIAQKAYNGKLSVKEGARALMSFFESYLDVDVKADLSGLKTAAAGTYSDAQKAAAAFMVMYARMQDLFSSMSKKVERAGEVYNQAKDIVNMVIKLVKTIGSGDLNAIADNLLDMGADLVSTVIDAWLSPIKDAIGSVKELYEIGKHAYKGDLSLREGAQLLIDFYENYLDVSVTADLRGVSDGVVSQSEKIAAAFMVMYAQMKNIYSTVSSKVDQATSLYHQAMSIINTLLKLLDDPMAALEGLVDTGKDAIFTLLNAYLDKINGMIDSVMDIYELGKRAYQGDIDIKEGAELLIGFFEKYMKVSISADLDAIGEDNKKAVSDTLAQGKKMALAFMAMYARMKNIYSSLNSKVSQLTDVYDQMMEIVDTVKKLFTDPASGAFALMDLVKDRIMQKLDGLGMYKDMFMQVLDVIENFDDFDPSELLDEAMSFAVTTARVKADQALYSTIYGMLVTAATTLDPNSEYEWDPGELKTSLPTYRLMSFGDEAEFQEYEKKIAEQNQKKQEAAKKDNANKKTTGVGTDGVMVKITGLIRQIGDGDSVTDYIVDTSSEPAIINNTVAFKGGDLVFTQGKLKISFGSVATIDAGEYISKAQSIYGSETPLFDTLFVSGDGQLYIQGSGFVFHEGEWSLDFYNGFDKVLDPEAKKETDEKKKNAEESDALNETAAWAIGALNDLFNPLKALAITDVYFNRHTLFSAPSFSVAGFGLTFDNYLLRSNEVCFGGHIDFKIVKGEIQNVFFNSSGLQSIEADLIFDLGGDLGLLEKSETAGGTLVIHYYDPDYLASFRERGYEPPEEKYALDFKAKLKSVGGVGVQISFKRVADGRILPDIIGFQATPPSPGLLVTGGTYLTEIRGAIKELADTIAGGSSTVPLIIEAGVDIKFGQAPATFDGKIDMILKMTGIEFNGKLGYKGKPMITQAQIKAQWVTPWFVSASMEMDVLGLNIIIGKARLFIGQNLEKDRIDFEGFVSAALQIPKSVPVVGGFQLGQVSFGLNNDKIWGSASVGVTPIAVSVGITYYWGGGVEFGTSGENLPEAYTYLVLERPEEEPVLVAIGSGMRTEATSWVNEDTIHEIEYHAIGDGVSMLDNGQNDIGLGGIEVSNEGRTHVIPMGNVATDRDGLIEIEYYGDEKTASELQSMLTLQNGDGSAYPVRIGDMNHPQTGDTAFRQELVTEDGVNRHLVYVMVPHGSIRGSFTLDSAERVQTKLLSTPIASSLSGVTLSGSGTSYTADVTVANAHDGDTVALYLTRETVGTAVEYLTTEDADGSPVQIPVTEDKDPGVMIFDAIPVGADGVVTQAFDLDNITGTYAVGGLGDIRELLESGEYYLRAALKSDTGYDAKTSADSIEITDPKAPGTAGGARLENAGNGYFNLSFAPGSTVSGNNATDYRIDFCLEDGTLCTTYNGLVFSAADLAEYYNGATGRYENLRLGGWTVTSGDGSEESPYSYAGLEIGKNYVVKVYAASRTDDGNYHYAQPAQSAVTLLPQPLYVKFLSMTADSGTMELKKYTEADGTVVATTVKELVTNQPAPELTLTTNRTNPKVEAYNGETLVGTMDANGKLKLTGLTTDGDYAIELRAQNTATQDLSVTVLYVTIDTSRPSILVVSPAAENAKGVNFNSILINGMTEPGSKLTANGVSIPVDDDGVFTGSVTLNNALPDGKITLKATDKAGNVNSAVVSVTNSNYAAPVGINVVRTGTMKTGATQDAQVYLNYADGRSANGTQKYRSAKVANEDRDKLSFSVIQGDAVTVSDSGTITAVREGGALVTVGYQVNETRTLKTTIAFLVDDNAQPTAVIDENTGSGGGGSASEEAVADVVINGKSDTVAIDENGTATITVTEEDGIDTARTLDVQNLSEDASGYVLEVDKAVAEALSGEDGKGVRFSGGGTQVELPGETLTGSALTITVSEPDAATRKAEQSVAKSLGAEIVSAGTTVTISGAEIEPGDRVLTRIEIPAGVNTEDITALVFIDKDGNSTNLPWKMTVAGSTAYVECYLPGSGTVVPMSGGRTFSDVSPNYWGASAIEEAAGQLLIRGYEDGTFRPNANVTRAEFATVMLRAAGLMTASGAAVQYTDVKTTDWFYDAISIATALQIMNGYTDGSARPNASIRRVEGMVIASRLLKLEKLCGEITDEEVEQELSKFSDHDELPAWARKDIALCVRSGIIVGSDGAIKPNDTLSRVQAAIIATRLSAAIAKTM